MSLSTDVPHLFFGESASHELEGIKKSPPEKLHIAIGDTDES